MSIRISRELFEALKLTELKHYRIAQKAGMHPSSLSRILNGIDRIRENDPRVLRIGKVLGIPAERLFEWREERR